MRNRTLDAVARFRHPDRFLTGGRSARLAVLLEGDVVGETNRVLVVDDDALMTRTLGRSLARCGFDVIVAHDPVTARAHLERGPFELVITDVRLTRDPRDRSGIDVLSLARQSCAYTVAITGSDDPVLVRDVMAVRPDRCLFKREIVGPRLASELRDLVCARRRGAPVSAQSAALRALIGESAPMRKVREEIEAYAALDSPVLITGENGTGKELVAGALHALSKRKGPFEALSVCEIASSLFESELFGHVRGAFSGAEHEHAGAFERARDGTLFLDEIGDLSIDLQPKLLRAIESRTVRRLGGRSPTDVRVRLVCATNADLAQAIEAKRFRRDLFHRLEVLRIDLPPLRERREDIPALLSAFGARFGQKLTPDAIEWLSARPYPGNVRELRNLVERLAAARATTVDLPTAMRAAGVTPGPPAVASLRSQIRSLEQTEIDRAMVAAAGNKAAAARHLGISRFALLRRLSQAQNLPPPTELE